MTKENTLWHIENLPKGADVKVHYLHKDEELTISEICNAYPEDKDTQFHFIVAAERKNTTSCVQVPPRLPNRKGKVMVKFKSVNDPTYEEWKELFETYKCFDKGDLVEILSGSSYKFSNKIHTVVDLVELYKRSDDVAYKILGPDGVVMYISSTYLAPLNTFIENN